MRAAGLEQDGVVRVGQHRHQRQHIFLQKWFATRYLHQRATECFHRFDDFVQRLFLAFVEGVFRVAVTAAQIAESQPHKNAWPSCPGAFTLDGVVNLVDRQPFLGFGHWTLSVGRWTLSAPHQNFQRREKPNR
jgi:hypothetical protein